MSVDNNEVGTTNHPGGLNISVPDLTVARPIDTIVETGGQLFISQNASSPSYAAIGGPALDLDGNLASAATGGSFTVSIPAGAGLPVVLPDPVAAGLFVSVTATVDGGGTYDLQTNPAFNVAGNTTAQFTALNQSVLFYGVTDPAGGFRWQLANNDGTTLS